MKAFRLLAAASLLAVTLSGSALAAPPADVSAPEEFSALSGVDAEALPLAEMDAIHGALTPQELYDALVAKAGLIQNDYLRQRALAFLAANQAKIIAGFTALLACAR